MFYTETFTELRKLNKSHISMRLHDTSLTLQVEQAEAGLESLSSSEKTIDHLRENFVSIEKYVVDEIY